MSDDENACVRNIVREIMRECSPRKIKVNKNFVSYLTTLLLIDPNWNISDDFFIQRKNVQIFVKYVIEELLEKQDHPFVCTLQIQFYFACNFKHMDFLIEANRKDIRSRLTRLRDDIFLVQNISRKEELDNLFKKIVYYLTLVSGLGNPTLPKVYEEVSSALKSILTDEDLTNFAKSSKSSKHESVEQFIKIVTGIRLFNKDCNRGGEGIENLPDLLNKAIDVIKEGIQISLLNIMDKVNTLTTIVDRCYISRKFYNQYEMVLEIPKNISELIAGFNIEYTKDLLILVRQYELIVRSILEQLDNLLHRGDTIVKNMKKHLTKIHDTVFMRIAIPVHTIFPLFEQLSNIWFQLQDQVLLLSRFSQIISNLESYVKQTDYSIYMIDNILGENGALTDAQRLEKTAHLKIQSENTEVKILSIENFKNIDKIDLEYLGFCCWKLIETDGALIPGNPGMGIARYKNKNYVFSCQEGGLMFSKNPETIIERVLDLARRKPQLINFLQLMDELEKVYGVQKYSEVQEKTDPKMCETKKIQTTDHVEGQHNPNYKWNVWDLKRDALNLANRLKYKTTSSQTDKSLATNSVKTQTHANKQTSLQSTRDNCTNVPKQCNYIYGLRGRHDGKQFIIDLTSPVSYGMRKN